MQVRRHIGSQGCIPNSVDILCNGFVLFKKELQLFHNLQNPVCDRSHTVDLGSEITSEHNGAKPGMTATFLK